MRQSLRWHLILSIGLAHGAAALSSEPGGARVPSLDEILQRERQIIESRKALQSGRVVIRNRLTRFDLAPDQTGIEKRYVNYFQGGRFRSDQDVQGRHLYQAVFTPDVCIRAYDGESSVLVLGPRNRPKDARDLPDPRRLGIVVWFFDSINVLGYEHVLLRPNRDQFKIEPAMDGEDPVWKVSFRMRGGNQTTSAEYWLCDSKGGLPVYIRLSAGEGDSQTTRSLKAALKQYGANRVWYPSEVRFQRTRGNRITTEEIVCVDDAVFGEDVPEKTFTLAGLGLPKGRGIDMDGRLLVWDGERVVQDYEMGGHRTPHLRDLPRSPARVAFLASSIALAMMAVVLLWYRQLKKNPGL